MTKMPTNFSEEFEKKVHRFLAPLALYHRYEIRGLSNVPKKGPALLVFSHSLATYDGLLFGYKLFESEGIRAVALGDDLLFKLPFVAEFADKIGVVPANPMNAKKLLAKGHIVAVAPGGMREALRPTTDSKYQVLWQRRLGFIRLALETQVPIILAACPAANDIYTVYENRLTKIFYKYFKLPVPVMRGLGLTWIPRPTKLIHYVSEPIIPPKLDKKNKTAQVNQLHAKVKREMKKLMAK